MAQKTQPKFESNPFKVIFNGFDKLFKHNQSMAIVLLIFSLFSSIGQFFNYDYSSPQPSGAPAEEAFPVAGIVAIIVGVAIVVLPLIIFIATMINGFTSYVAYKTSKGESTGFSESMKVVWSKFWTILRVEISVFFRILGGTLLLIIPGIRAALRYDMVLFPVFDENASAKQAVAKSKAVTKKHLIEIFGMSFASSLIPIIGQVMHVGGQSIMYPQLVALNKSGAAKPKVHWLNYLAFFLVLGVLIFVSAIVSLVVLVAR